MISYLRGTLVRKDPASCIVDIHGVGMETIIPRSTFEALGELEHEITLLTYLHVREDALVLFGFSTEEERDLFRLLLSVTGIGPKLALGVLSGYKVQDIYQFIADGNEAALGRISGLGKKTVQRIILDLKDKAIVHIKRYGLEYQKTYPHAGVTEEAVLALMSLGHSRIEAEKAVLQALSRCGGGATLEELVRMALLQKKV